MRRTTAAGMVAADRAGQFGGCEPGGEHRVRVAHSPGVRLGEARQRLGRPARVQRRGHGGRAGPAGQRSAASHRPGRRRTHRPVRRRQQQPGQAQVHVPALRAAVGALDPGRDNARVAPRDDARGRQRSRQVRTVRSASPVSRTSVATDGNAPVPSGPAWPARPVSTNLHALDGCPPRSAGTGARVSAQQIASTLIVASPGESSGASRRRRASRASVTCVSVLMARQPATAGAVDQVQCQAHPAPLPGL